MKYGNGCAMCIYRCPTFGPRFSIAAKAGVPEIMGQKADGTLAIDARGGVLQLLWALGLDESIDLLADPDRDLHGKALEASHRAQRVRGGRASDTSRYDF